MTRARMNHPSRSLPTTVTLSASLAVFLAFGSPLSPFIPAQHAIAAEADAVPVMTVPAKRQPVSKSAEYVGRIEARERVEIRARVTGVLEAVQFREGDTIKEGTPLYRIEKALFEADVTQAQGALDRASAQLKLATIQRVRAEELLARDAGTVVARDQAAAQEDEARAAVTSAQASLQTARINLGYTDILAPISGQVSRTLISRGNIVGPSSGALTGMVSQDPMYVSFPVSQRDIMTARKTGSGADPSSIKLNIYFSDGSLYDQPGQITFADISVNQQTDTLMLRGTIANPDNRLTDGQLVRVELQSGTPQEQIVVPQAALIADQQGVYIFIAENGKAAIRRIKTQGNTGDNAVVSSGLEGGELVIVEGFQNLRPGMAVRAAPATTLNTKG